MKAKTLLFSCLVAGAYFAPGPVLAAERLAFNAQPGASSQLALETYAQDTLKQDLSNFDLAKADLNGDGIDEFVARPKSCPALGALCDYNLWAETQEGVISLGTVSAKTVLLGSERSQGVRNVLAFDNISNDFEYSLYVWKPDKAVYEKKDP